MAFKNFTVRLGFASFAMSILKMPSLQTTVIKFRYFAIDSLHGISMANSRLT